MPKPSVHRSYLGESAEARVQARRRLLIDAAFERLSTEGGLRRLSIAQLCRDANLNKRYFYESFADLDALAGAVVDDLATRLLAIGQGAAMEAIQAQMDTPTLARHVLKAVIEWLVDDPRRASLLFTVIADHPRAQAQRQDAIAKLAQGLSAFSLEYHQATEPHVIAQVGSALLVGGSIEVVLAWLEGRLPVSLDELVDDLASFWVGVGDSAIALTKQRADADAPKRRRAPKRRKPAE
jgi:AcrR family transcriptional regulator